MVQRPVVFFHSRPFLVFLDIAVGIAQPSDFSLALSDSLSANKTGILEASKSSLGFVQLATDAAIAKPGSCCQLGIACS